MRFKSLVELKNTVHPLDLESKSTKTAIIGLQRNFNSVESSWPQDREKAFKILYKIKISLDRMRSEKAVVDLQKKVETIYCKWSNELENDYKLKALMTKENRPDLDVVLISDTSYPEKNEEPEVITTFNSHENRIRTDPTNEFIFPEDLYQMRSQNNYIVFDIRSTEAFQMCHMANDISFIRIPTEILTDGLSAATLEQRLDYDARVHFKQRGCYDKLILMGDDDDGLNRNSKTYAVLKIMKEWDPHTTYNGTQKILYGGIRDFAEKYPGLTICQIVDSNDEEIVTLDKIVYPQLEDTLTTVRNPSYEPTLPMSSPSVFTRHFFCKPTGDELKELRKMKPRQEDMPIADEFPDSQDLKTDSICQKLFIESETESSVSKRSSQPESTTLRRTVSTPNIAEAVIEPIVTEVPSFNRSNKPSPMRSSLPEIYDKGLDPVYGQTDPGYTGLKNTSNNCYLNTAIQVIAHISEVSNFFHNQYRYQINNESKYKGTIAEETSRLVKALWSGLYTSVSASSLKKVVAKYCPRFKGNSQEDCQEFLIILLDYLHEDLSYDVSSEIQGHSESEKAWFKYNRNKRSLVSDLFYGQSQTCVVCENCTHSSVSYQVFACIPLDLVSDNGAVDLRERMDKYFQTERIEYRCEKCSYNHCMKKTRISRNPVYLIIQLVRFNEQPGRSFNKSKTMVQIPNLIDLRNFTVNETALSYKLQSIACHRGVIDCGHYKAYCYSPKTKSFVLFDDTSVTDVPNDFYKRKDVQQDAYIVLYKLTPLHQLV